MLLVPDGLHLPRQVGDLVHLNKLHIQLGNSREKKSAKIEIKRNPRRGDRMANSVDLVIQNSIVISVILLILVLQEERCVA